MKNLKKLIVLITACTLSLSITACVGTNKTKADETAYPVSVMNMQIDNAPNSVACLSPAIATMLIELGYSDKIVGYADDYEGENATEQNRIGTGLELNMEQIGKLAPEIIFTNVPITKAQMDKLETVNVRVMVMPAVTNIAEVKQRYLDLVSVMGGELESKSKGANFVAEIDRVFTHITATVPTKQSFLYIASLDPVIATPDTIQSAIACVVLGSDVAKDQSNYAVPNEIIKTYKPDVILYDSSITPNAIKESDVFGSIPAVKNGKMFSVKGSDMALATSGIKAVATTLASTVYKDVDFTTPALDPSTDK